MHRKFGLLWRCLVVFVLTISLSVSTAAASPQKIRTLHPQFGRQVAVVRVDHTDDTPSPQNIVAYPGSQVTVLLCGADGQSLFADQDGQQILTQDVTLSRLKAGRVSLVSEPSAQQNLLQSAELTYWKGDAITPQSAPALVLQFAEDSPVSAEGSWFSYRFSLAIAGEKQPQSQILLSGRIRCGEKTVDASTQSLYLAPGSVAVAGEHVPKIQLQLGSDVSLETSMPSGSRCGATVRRRTPSFELLGMLPTAVEEVSITGIGLENAHSVRLGGSAQLYVFDGQGQFLGRSSDPLPYRETYYLTEKMH